MGSKKYSVKSNFLSTILITMEKKDIITQHFIDTKLKLNIAGEEISSLLDTNELYPAARARF